MAIALATVYGGSGFLGRYVVRALARSGARVRVAVRRPEEARFLMTAGVVGQVMPVAANLRDEGSVRAAAAGADAVVNLVGLLYQSGRQRFQAVHVDGARRVARAAREAGARALVHVSAIGADPASPSAYGRTKAEGEAAVRAAFPEAAVLRPSIMFGPEDDFFNRFAAIARLSPVMPLIGGGHTRFQPVYVADVADAVMAALTDDAARGRIFELGGPHVYTFRALIEYLLEVTGRRRLLVPVPFWLMTLEAALLELLPTPPLTRDQLRMLRRDNVVTPGAPGLAELGVAPTALEVIAPTYLSRYRRAGRRLAGGPAPGAR